MLSKMRGFIRNTLGQLIQKMCPVNRISPKLITDAESVFLLPNLCVVVAVHPVEPHLLLVRRLVAGSHFLKRLVHVGRTDFHGPRGGRVERYTGSDLAKVGCLLEYIDVQSAAEKSDCQSDTADTAADDGNLA